MIWLQFMICVLVIGFAGIKLSHYGDAIADKTGLGGTWIGLVLLASVTSLPELVTGVSSVTIANVPDIAVGDILGSCVFNLLIIVVLDFLHRDESVYTRARQGHILSAGFGVILIGFAGFNILLSSSGFTMALGHIGTYSLLIVVLYGVAMSTVFRYERKQLAEFAAAEADRFPEFTLRQLMIRYLAAALLVVAAGSWLPFVAKHIAQQMGWYESFVGTLLVAFVTSLPELVVTVAALRLNALDMAIGNLFGSNLFNILILTVDDILYTPGPLLAHVSTTHAVSAISAIMMTGVAIVALLYRTKTRVLKTVGWASIYLFTIYLFNSYVIYLYGK
jgi:cation:H+ antiporter